MSVITQARQRRTETPNGVMTTCASPTQGGTSIAVWRVEVPAGTAGPEHSIDVEQVWTFVDGSATVVLDGDTHEANARDAVVLPAGAVRQILAGATGYCAVVAAPAGGTARVPGSDEPIAPAWMR